MTKTLDRSKLPCKFGRHFSDLVPMPFGSGNCEMPGFECGYDGEGTPLDECEENDKCPCYKPVDTKVCKKHVPNTRYYGFCPACEDIEARKMAEAEESYDKASRGL